MVKRFSPAFAACTLGWIVLQTPTASATVLFDDSFASFSLGTNWNSPAYLAATSLGFIGAPNVNLSSSGSGLVMTSAQNNDQTTGIATTQEFTLSSGTVALDFTTGPPSDPSLVLPPGTVDQNIDGVIALKLVNPLTDNYLEAFLFGGDYGTEREFVIRSSLGPDVDSVASWNYGESYSVIFSSSGGDVSIAFDNSSGTPPFSYALPVGFGYLGDFNVALEQLMGTPGQPYVNDVVVNQVEVTSNNVASQNLPEPTSAFSFGIGLLALAAIRTNRRPVSRYSSCNVT